MTEHPPSRDPGKAALAQYLEDIFLQYHHPEFICPDPLEFLSRYPSTPDREIVALVAALLAYGRVAQIQKSVERVLSFLTPKPRKFLTASSSKEITSICAGFVHRFTKAEALSSILIGIRSLILCHGGLEACFGKGDVKEHSTILPGLVYLVRELQNASPINPGHLLPDPSKGSALKRFNLFLRWMVRQDAVDPGGWNSISPSRLIVPLDVHMHRMAIWLGLTRRSAADMRTALEVTEGFREICSDDPVRFDFSLTRLGIRKLHIPQLSLSPCP